MIKSDNLANFWNQSISTHLAFRPPVAYVSDRDRPDSKPGGLLRWRLSLFVSSLARVLSLVRHRLHAHNLPIG
jgi:hypothetical protein